MNSWKGSVRPRAPTQVDTGWSLIGSTRAPTPIASTTLWCASVSLSPRAQALRPEQAHREVAVAEAKPGRPPSALERVHHLPGVVPQPPAALVDLVRQPVGHEVRVRGHVHAVYLHVVAGVGHHGELVARVREPARELCPAASPGQHHHGIHCE